jgi:hypothetical protein
MLRSTEPSCHVLLECQRALEASKDIKLHRLIGQALDRWGISKDELRIRNRLCELDFNASPVSEACSRDLAIEYQGH